MCATHMYDNNVPEQVIKEVTGHKSKYMRTYKHVSDQLRETASHTLSTLESCSGVSKAEVSECSSIKKIKVEENEAKKEGTLSVQQMIHNINKTKLEIRYKKFLKAKSRLSLSHFRQQKKLTIDVNFNISK